MELKSSTDKFIFDDVLLGKREGVRRNVRITSVCWNNWETLPK